MQKSKYGLYPYLHNGGFLFSAISGKSAHVILKMFLNAQNHFMKDELQGYLNLFLLITNPHDEMLENVELVVISAFNNHKTLRYREFYTVKKEF